MTAPVSVELGPGATAPGVGTAAADLAAADLTNLRARAEGAGDAEVERALHGSRRTLADFAALISPAARPRLEELAGRAQEVTVRRFGRTIHLFAPLYLSNECVSSCTYCGFSATNQIARRTLSPDEVLGEAGHLLEQGFRHLLLVSGEHARIVSRDYLVECVRALAPDVPSISVEVQAWDGPTYRRLVDAGCDGLVVYQETYDRGSYAGVHLRGKKRNYDWRLAALDRGAEAGMRRLGLGILLGLHADWRSDALALAAHTRALLRRWWRCEVTLSLPRLRPAAGVQRSGHDVGDADFVQLLCALRLLLPDVGISLSTREAPDLRDALLPLGVTHLSAGSRTEPGGYSSPGQAEAQFEVGDTRSVVEVAAMVRASGFDTVWKDWQRTPAD